MPHPTPPAVRRPPASKLVAVPFALLEMGGTARPRSGSLLITAAGGILVMRVAPLRRPTQTDRQD